MTDKELLQLAAQAAGIELTDFHGVLVRPDVEAGCPPWNPLDDDGDALRLAVCLALTVIPAEPDADAVASRAGGAGPWIAVETGSDKYAATRRAIVRAAAAIQLAKVPA